ncbi:hypothetical protein EG327_004307 [Venturia inaequalis]|uniref:Uncharacterized protein n=2 Tax=Venturia inaequalis TaxID=5025 RepID=A0A8H3VG46_VENIN|nr:hypothetical protein EG327_004307 [Venturia inaequalis]
MSQRPHNPQMTTHEQRQRFNHLSAAFALTPEEQARDNANRGAQKSKQLETTNSQNTVKDDTQYGTGEELAPCFGVYLGLCNPSECMLEFSQQERISQDEWSTVDTVSRSVLSHLKGKQPEEMDIRELQQVVSTLPYMSQLRRSAAAEMRRRDV